MLFHKAFYVWTSFIQTLSGYSSSHTFRGNEGLVGKKESLKRTNSNFNVSKPVWVRFHIHLLQFYNTETYTLNFAWNLEELSPCLKIAQFLEFKNMFMVLSQTKLPTCKTSSDYLFLQMDISNNIPELGGTHLKVSYRQHPTTSHI